MNPPDAGEIRVREAVRSTTIAAIRQGIAYVSEDRLSLGLVIQTIADNTVISVLDKLTGPLRAQLAHAGEAIGISFPGVARLTKTADRHSTLGRRPAAGKAKWLATGRVSSGLLTLAST
jgi:hypothetical protein